MAPKPSLHETGKDERGGRVGDRILRDAEVRSCTGLSRTTRWRLIKAKKFPAAVPLTEHAIGWKESEIQEWIEARRPKTAA